MPHVEILMESCRNWVKEFNSCQADKQTKDMSVQIEAT